MPCEHKNGGICCGSACFPEKEFRSVVQMIEDAETVSRTLAKCRKIDELLQGAGILKQMNGQTLEKTFRGTLCPLNRTAKNAEIARRLEAAFLDEALIKAGLVKMN